jgi:glyceraldehyde-3-phosphate dehydrogenase (NAD(P))
MGYVLWEEGVTLDGRDLRFFQEIHQESVVVPVNLDAIRAILDLALDPGRSIAMTDQAWGVQSPAVLKAPRANRS